MNHNRSTAADRRGHCQRLAGRVQHRDWLCTRLAEVDAVATLTGLCGGERDGVELVERQNSTRARRRLLDPFGGRFTERISGRRLVVLTGRVALIEICRVPPPSPCSLIDTVTESPGVTTTGTCCDAAGISIQ